MRAGLCGDYPLAVRSFLRSLNPRLPRSVQILQAGGLANSFGNGLASRSCSSTSTTCAGSTSAPPGLIVATNGAVGLVAGPIGGIADRPRRRASRRSIVSLLFMTVGYGALPVRRTSRGRASLVAAIAGIGNGGFWPSQSSLIAGAHAAGAAAHGVRGAARDDEPRDRARRARRRADRDHRPAGHVHGRSSCSTRSRSSSSSARSRSSRSRAHGARERRARRGSYRDGASATASSSPCSRSTSSSSPPPWRSSRSFPAYAKNEAGVSERGIGSIWFVNTVVIVLAQLPIARALEGRRRMPVLALLGVVWAARARARPGRRDGSTAGPRSSSSRRRRGLRDRRVPARDGAGAARRRSRRPPADRPLHGAVGVLVERRLHGRARDRRLRPRAAPTRVARRRGGLPRRRRGGARARARAARARPADAARRPRAGAGRAPVAGDASRSAARAAG